MQNSALEIYNLFNDIALIDNILFTDQPMTPDQFKKLLHIHFAYIVLKDHGHVICRYKENSSFLKLLQQNHSTKKNNNS